MRRHRVWLALGFGFITAVHLWTFLDPPMMKIHGDGYYTYLFARSLVFDGDWDLTNDYELCGDPWRMRTRMGPPEPGMRPHNPWNPGPALVWGPFLLAVKLLSSATGDPNPRIAQACQGPMADFSMTGTLVAGLLTVLLAYRMARRHVGAAPAFLGAAAIGLATSLPYYSTILPSYNHAVAAFGVALFLERWDATRGSRRWYRWLFIGLLLGLSMLIRAQTALLALCPLVEWIALAMGDARDRRFCSLARHVAVGLLFTAAALLVFSPQLFLWKATYGTYLAVPQGEHFMRWSTPHLDGVFFASTGGLLVWTPILYGAFFGLLGALFVRRERGVAFALLLFVASMTYVNASAYDYFGSASFSNRRFTELAMPFAFGIALFVAWVLRWAERRPRAFGVTVATCAVLGFGAWNYAAMWAHAKGKIRSHVEQPMPVFWQQTFDELSDNVWGAVGNPFAFPASIPFALQYDTHPRRWDVMRGMVVFYQNEQTREPRTRQGEDEARFGRPHQFLYAVEGFAEEPARVDGKQAAVTEGKHARMLVPFFWDDVAAVEIRWKAMREPGEGTRPARAVLRWNGVDVAQVDVPPRWQTTRIEMPRDLVVIGINEVVFFVDDGPIAFEAIKAIQIPREHVPARVAPP